MKKVLLSMIAALAFTSSVSHSHPRDYTPIALMSAAPAAVGSFVALCGYPEGVAFAFIGSAVAGITGSVRFNKPLSASCLASGVTLGGFLLTAKLCQHFMKSFKPKHGHHHPHHSSYGPPSHHRPHY